MYGFKTLKKKKRIHSNLEKILYYILFGQITHISKILASLLLPIFLNLEHPRQETECGPASQKRDYGKWQIFTRVTNLLKDDYYVKV